MSVNPSFQPSHKPSLIPSPEPSLKLSFNPSSVVTDSPSSNLSSSKPSIDTTTKPSSKLTSKPSNSSSEFATSGPSNEMTNTPSHLDVVEITSVHRSCEDDPKFRFWNKEINKRVNCGYIMHHRPIDAKIQREKFCLQNSKIFQRCKWSCGKCDNSIHDDPTFRFRQGKNNKFTKCKFITANSKERKSRQRNLCQKSHDGVDVKDACALSCGNFG